MSIQLEDPKHISGASRISPRRATLLSRIIPYLRIARPTHWFKNVFMVPGALLVFFFDPHFTAQTSLAKLAVGFAAACIIASSNYVLNEILDAASDRFHPVKKHRPIPSGQVSASLAYAEWLLLAGSGFGLAVWVGWRFAATVLLLWVMGLLYNVRPIRLKDLPYADVLSESINNPIRMAMGWYATGYESAPTLSVLVAYWMFGAFLMATKRFAEYRVIGSSELAASYRSSFAHYDEERLLGSILFYASLFAMFSGVFIARYRIELVLAAPLICLFLGYYLHLGFAPNSPAQQPERLYQVRPLVGLAAAAFVVCFLLLFVDVPVIRQMFREWYEWHPGVR